MHLPPLLSLKGSNFFSFAFTFLAEILTGAELIVIESLLLLFAFLSFDGLGFPSLIKGGPIGQIMD